MNLEIASSPSATRNDVKRHPEAKPRDLYGKDFVAFGDSQ